MRRHLLLPLLAVVALGAAPQLPRTPTSPAPLPAGFQRVAVSEGVATAPGCAEDSPLFRSMMPDRISYRPASEKAEKGEAPEAEAAPPEPAMRQALHLCVVETFDPRRPFGSLRRIVHRT